MWGGRAARLAPCGPTPSEPGTEPVPWQRVLTDTSVSVHAGRLPWPLPPGAQRCGAGLVPVHARVCAHACLCARVPLHTGGFPSSAQFGR